MPGLVTRCGLPNPVGDGRGRGAGSLALLLLLIDVDGSEVDQALADAGEKGVAELG